MDLFLILPRPHLNHKMKHISRLYCVMLVGGRTPILCLLALLHCWWLLFVS